MKSVSVLVPACALILSACWDNLPDESAMTAEEYILNCAEVSDREFEANCEGKIVIFDGIIRAIDDNDELEVDVISETDKIQGFDLFLKTDHDFEVSWQRNEGRAIRFAGALEDNDFNDHNIEEGIVIELGALAEADANKARLVAIRDEEKARDAGFADYAAMTACKENWSDCGSHDQLIKYYTKLADAREACKASALTQAPAGQVKIGGIMPFQVTLEGEDALANGAVTLFAPASERADDSGEMIKTNIRCLFDLTENKVSAISFD